MLVGGALGDVGAPLQGDREVVGVERPLGTFDVELTPESSDEAGGADGVDGSTLGRMAMSKRGISRARAGVRG
jgi:hypothetical protein